LNSSPQGGGNQATARLKGSKAEPRRERASVVNARMVELMGFDYDWPWLKKKLIKHFLPLGLLVALIWSLVWPLPGKEVCPPDGFPCHPLTFPS
jgi:hypothetical protein